MKRLAVSLLFVPLPAARADAAGFEEAQSRAQAAHQAQRLEEAAQSYREALDQRPQWGTAAGPLHARNSGAGSRVRPHRRRSLGRADSTRG